MLAAGSLKGGIKKDSLINAEETGEFVVNIVPYGLRDDEQILRPPAQRRGRVRLRPRRPAVDDGEAARVKGAPVLRVQVPPNPGDALLAEGEHNWVCFGQVIGIHCDDSLLVDGKVDVTSYPPLARLPHGLHGGG